MDLGNDPNAALEQVSSMVTTMKGVTPPADISADWSTLTTTFSDLHDVLAQVLANPGAADAQEKLTTAMSGLADEDLLAANERIEDWGKANC